MYTIYDYLKYYKNHDVKEVTWNNIDNLLLSIIVYMPLESFMGTISFDEMCKKIEKFKFTNKTEFLSPKVKELIEIIKDSKRYKKLKFKNFVNQLDNNTQFGAMTCKINNIKIIVFKGTDRSIIGWIENFRLMYEYPTYTQNLAYKYLKNNLNVFDKNVYVVGHSKGGNMAMYSTMNLSLFKFHKIKNVINFDGPGFMKKEFDSDEFKRMSSKLINIVPSNSYIGVLMYNSEYVPIKTSAHAINVHYPIYWNTYGEEFVIEKLSNMSKELHKRTSSRISSLDSEKFKTYFETTFKTIDYKKTSNISLGLKDIVSIFKTVKGIDEDTSEYVTSVLKSMIKVSRGKEK